MRRGRKVGVEFAEARLRQKKKRHKFDLRTLLLPSSSTSKMSTPSADPSRLQTRAKNVNQHPGDAVVKRKRRTAKQMEEAREQERQQAEAMKKVREEQILAAAKMEDEIAERDKQAAVGIATKKAKAKVSTKKAKKVPAPVPVVPDVVPDVS